MIVEVVIPSKTMVPSPSKQQKIPLDKILYVMSFESRPFQILIIISAKAKTSKPVTKVAKKFVISFLFFFGLHWHCLSSLSRSASFIDDSAEDSVEEDEEDEEGDDVEQNDQSGDDDGSQAEEDNNIEWSDSGEDARQAKYVSK